ncbi:MAG: molybdopterin biosynthesis protein MoeY, partial [Rubrivivax sp.]
RWSMDFVPAMACAAHLVILAPRPGRSLEANLAAGRALQRVWLTVTRLGLELQPELTPLIFSGYASDERTFSSVRTTTRDAEEIRYRLGQQLGEDGMARAVFMARIGRLDPARARSLRRALSDLTHLESSV